MTPRIHKRGLRRTGGTLKAIEEPWPLCLVGRWSTPLQDGWAKVTCKSCLWQKPGARKEQKG